MKKCIKCNKEKDYSFFHKSKTQKDGYYYYCKECKSLVAKEEYKKNKQDYIDRCYKWRKTEKGKESIKKTYQKQKEKFPEKYKARTALNNAIQYGKIIRPNNCEKCNKECSPHGHHEDYSKPLEVIWVCESCHTKIHQEYNAI